MDTEGVKVSLDGKEYIADRYELSDQQVFGPRFGSGALDESDLTLRRSLTFRAGDAASLRPSENGKLQSRVVLGLINEIENIVTPTAHINVGPWSQIVSGNNYSAGWDDAYMYGAIEGKPSPFYRADSLCDWKITDRIWFKNKLFIGLIHGSSCAVINFTDRVNITLPASFTTNGKGPFFATRNRVLYVANNVSGMHYLNSGATALTKVTGATGSFKQIWNMNGRMYGLNSSANAIYEWTGSTTTDTFTKIVDVRDDTDGTTYPLPMAVLNGRAYLAVHDKIIVFDGVRSYTFTGDKATVMCEYQGNIYFDSRGRIMRTNGSSIEILFDLNVQEYTNGVSVVPDGMIHDIYVYNNKLYFMISHRQMDADYSYGEFLRKNLMLPSDVATNQASASWESEGVADGLAAYAYNGKELTLAFTTAGLGAVSPYTGVLGDNTGHRAAQFVDDGLNLFVVRYEDTDVADTGYTRYARVYADMRPLRIVFRPSDFNFSSLKKKILGFSVVFNRNVIPTTQSDPSSEDAPIQLYYRTLSDGGTYPPENGWTLCKEWKDIPANNIFEGDPDIDIPATENIEFLFVTGLLYTEELPDLRGLVSLTVEYVVQSYYKAQWNLVLKPPASIEANLNQTSDPTLLQNVKDLRDNQTVFTFTDIDGTTYPTIIDSFSASVMTSYEDGDNDYAPQISVVIREV